MAGDRFSFTAARFLLYHAGLVGSPGTRLQGTAPLEGVRPGPLYPSSVLQALSSCLLSLAQGSPQGFDAPVDVPQPGLGLLLQALALWPALTPGALPHTLQPRALPLELGYKLLDPFPPARHALILPGRSLLPMRDPASLSGTTRCGQAFHGSRRRDPPRGPRSGRYHAGCWIRTSENLPSTHSTE